MTNTCNNLLQASFTSHAVIRPCYTRAISQRFRDRLGIIERYTNGLFTSLSLISVLYYKLKSF